MNKLTCIACALLLTTTTAAAADPDMTGATNFTGPVLTGWSPASTDIGYGFVGRVDRYLDGGAQPWSVLTVGAQIGVTNHAGINQVAFGIATEAWAAAGSFSMLTGLEATTINLEPENPWRKISLWSTFKNRPDTLYYLPPVDPANMDSQALRIESQPGTGFERGIVFAEVSMHASRKLARPAAIDFAEMSEPAVEGIDVMRFPDGCAVVYLGHGMLGTRCDK